jgi:hypothetical protein
LEVTERIFTLLTGFLALRLVVTGFLALRLVVTGFLALRLVATGFLALRLMVTSFLALRLVVSGFLALRLVVTGVPLGAMFAMKQLQGVNIPGTSRRHFYLPFEAVLQEYLQFPLRVAYLPSVLLS